MMHFRILLAYGVVTFLLLCLSVAWPFVYWQETTEWRWDTLFWIFLGCLFLLGMCLKSYPRCRAGKAAKIVALLTIVAPLLFALVNLARSYLARDAQAQDYLKTNGMSYLAIGWILVVAVVWKAVFPGVRDGDGNESGCESGKAKEGFDK